ncbi:MAG: protein kinase [Archangiaceae bacterium]|nr:protein kinase [Archangiaceae bacterium]
MLSLLDRTLLRAFSVLERYDRRARPRTGADPTAGALLAEGRVAAGRYRLEAVLGEGGMGRVWLAEDQLEHRRVAFKEMRAQVGGARPELDVAFKREFYTMTKLQHPNTVRVFDSGMLPSGDRYISMELVRGKDLSDLLKRGPLELKQLYRMLIDLANVLGFIHSRLFVHCDIKSANIRVAERGAVKVMDFGLMHQLGTPAGGQLKGTPHYMAPEVPRGGIIDARTDLYSLGVLAYELATGQLPFTGKTLTQIISQHLDKPPPPMRSVRQVPEGFEQIVQKLLAKDPAQRFQDSGELVRALSALSGISADVQDYGARTSYLHSAELIGRDGEQKQLKDALDALLAGKGRSILLTAPAGVGKTRLLQEFRLAVKLADVPFFIGHCRAEGQAPMAALVEALSQLVSMVPTEVLQQHGPVLARMLPAIAERGVAFVAPPPAANPKAVQFEALRALVRETARVRPFILCLEDLHWADSTTIEFMNVVIRELAGTKAMVLGTFRSNEVDRFAPTYATIDENVASELKVLPLTQADVTTLIVTMLRGIQLPTAFTDAMFATTAGNAFFVTETMRALIEQQALKVEAGKWSLSGAPKLPQSIEDAVTQRLSSLTATTLTLCRCIAPLGRVLDLELVKRVSQLTDEQLFATLDELVERQFLTKLEEQYYFSHDTVRAGIYRATPDHERAAAHERIGITLEALRSRDLEANAATLGYHFARGKSLDKAVRYLGQAGARALGSGLMLEGTRLLSEAADLQEKNGAGQAELVDAWARLVDVGSLAHPPTCVKFAEKLGPVIEQRIGGSEGFKAFNAEVRRLEERPGLTGKKKLTRIWSDQPIDPRSDDPLHLVPKLVGYRNAQALAYGALGQTPKAMELLGKLLADNPDPGPFRAATQISKTVGLFHMGMWGPLRAEAEQAHAWFEKHLATVGVLPTRMVWNHCATFYWLCNARGAMGLSEDTALYDRGLELASRHGFGDWRFFMPLTRNAAAAVTGIPERMQDTYGPVADIIKKLGNPPLMEARLSLFLPVFYLQRAEVALAEAAIAKVERLATAFKDAWMRRYGLVYRAQLAVLQDLARAQPAIDAAWAAVKEVPSFQRTAQLMVAQARAQALTDREAAKKTAEEAVTRATTGPTASPWDECQTRRALAEVQLGAVAVEAAQAAVDAARKHQLPLQEGLSLFALAVAAENVDRARAAAAIDAAEAQLTVLKCTEHLAAVAAWRRKAGKVR